MGRQNELEIQSILTGKSVETLIDEALDALKKGTKSKDVARQLNISRQALARHIERRQQTAQAGK